MRVLEVKLVFLSCGTDFFQTLCSQEFMTTPILLAPVGHTETHFMQEMHLAVSTVLGSESGKAER